MADTLLSRVLEDARNGERFAREYRECIEAASSDGRLRKAIEWGLTGLAGPCDPSVKCFALDATVRFMRHMGEDVVPGFLIVPGSKTTNVYLRTLMKDAHKRLSESTLKRAREESHVKDTPAAKKPALHVQTSLTQFVSVAADESLTATS